jgi:hypothetical protein
MITKDFATHFAHDLDRILAHYAEDFEMTSPLIVTMMGESSGLMKGKQAVGAYWAKALERRPELKFSLQKATFGVNSIAIHFQSETGKSSIDWCFFGEDGKVTKSFAHHETIEI